jgi:hypothetical protein
MLSRSSLLQVEADNGCVGVCAPVALIVKVASKLHAATNAKALCIIKLAFLNERPDLFYKRECGEIVRRNIKIRRGLTDELQSIDTCALKRLHRTLVDAFQPQTI